MKGGVLTVVSTASIAGLEHFICAVRMDFGPLGSNLRDFAGCRDFAVAAEPWRATVKRGSPPGWVRGTGSTEAFVGNLRARCAHVGKKSEIRSSKYHTNSNDRKNELGNRGGREEGRREGRKGGREEGRKGRKGGGEEGRKGGRGSRPSSENLLVARDYGLCRQQRS